jgi:hypothetical protein
MLLRVIAKFIGIEVYVTFSEAFFEAFFVLFLLLALVTMNRNGKSELVYVWGEILLRNMVFAHH